MPRTSKERNERLKDLTLEQQEQFKQVADVLKLVPGNNQHSFDKILDLVKGMQHEDLD